MQLVLGVQYIKKILKEIFTKKIDENFSSRYYCPEYIKVPINVLNYSCRVLLQHAGNCSRSFVSVFVYKSIIWNIKEYLENGGLLYDFNKHDIGDMYNLREQC